MAEILRPGASPQLSNAKINADSAGAGASAIGGAVARQGAASQQSNQLSDAMQLSRVIDAQGEKLFPKSN